MQLFGPGCWRQHRWWAMFVIVVYASSLAAYYWPGNEIRGSSGWGLLAGILAGLIMLHEATFAKRRAWAMFVIVASLAATAWYYWRSNQVQGLSAWGLLAGSVAGFLILYDSTFAKQPLHILRRLANWFLSRPRDADIPLVMHSSRNPGPPVRDRLRRHVWLGLLCGPMVYLHCGRHWGGRLPSALFIVFAVVFVSGMFGLLLQQFLPRLLRLDVPQEVNCRRIPHLIDQLRTEAELLVMATCGPMGLGDEFLGDKIEAPKSSRLRSALGVHRKGGGIGLLAHLPAAPIAGMGELQNFYRSRVAPFLAGKPASWSPRRLVGLILRRSSADGPGPLWSPDHADHLFWTLRAGLDPTCYGVIDALREACDQRRQYARQARLQAWLHAWLLVHLPCTGVLIVLLFMHVITSMIYF